MFPPFFSFFSPYPPIFSLSQPSLSLFRSPPTEQLRGTTGDSGISDPYSVVHHRHVAYDEGSRKYDGLPPEWEMHLKQQFGLPPNRVECEKMVRYKSRIPKILNLMKDQLFSNGGLEVVRCPTNSLVLFIFCLYHTLVFSSLHSALTPSYLTPMFWPKTITGGNFPSGS